MSAQNRSERRPDGGSAFQVAYQHDEATAEIHGMTMRDYFAAKAMASMMTHEAPADKTPEEAYEELAKSAYRISDAMLAERAKQ